MDLEKRVSFLEDKIKKIEENIKNVLEYDRLQIVNIVNINAKVDRVLEILEKKNN